MYDARALVTLFLLVEILILDICCRSNPKIFAFVPFFPDNLIYSSVSVNAGVYSPNLSLFTVPPSVMATV